MSEGEIIKTHVGEIDTVQESTNRVVTMLEKALYDPSIDINKLEQISRWYEQQQRRQAELEFNRAFARMQPELPIIEEKGDAGGRYTYARWEDINEQIKPVLKAHGFAIHFKSAVHDGMVTTTCLLRHEGGHVEAGEPFELGFDGSGNKNAVQAVGSSTSYGKRYTAMSMLNLQSTKIEDDDDRKGGSKVISEKQRDYLLEKLHEHDEDLEQFCKRHQIEAVSQLPEVKFDLAIAELKLKAANKHIKSLKEPKND